MDRRERPLTDELAALLGDLASALDDLVLAIQDIKANVCEVAQELRRKAAKQLYELADRLQATEGR